VSEGILASFTSAMNLGGVARLLLMLPLCLSVAIVYKTIRLPHVEDVPVAALRLWITVLGGMCAVGVGLWLLFELMV